MDPVTKAKALEKILRGLPKHLREHVVPIVPGTEEYRRYTLSHAFQAPAGSPERAELLSWFELPPEYLHVQKQPLRIYLGLEPEPFLDTSKEVSLPASGETAV